MDAPREGDIDKDATMGVGGWGSSAVNLRVRVRAPGDMPVVIRTWA